jgi:hypothetical protein
MNRFYNWVENTVTNRSYASTRSLPYSLSVVLIDHNHLQAPCAIDLFPSVNNFSTSLNWFELPWGRRHNFPAKQLNVLISLYGVKIWKTASVGALKLLIFNTYLLTYLITYLLTPWSKVLLEKLTVNFAASQEISLIYGIRKFLTVPTSARHLSFTAAW